MRREKAWTRSPARTECSRSLLRCCARVCFAWDRILSRNPGSARAIPMIPSRIPMSSLSITVSRFLTALSLPPQTSKQPWTVRAAQSDMGQGSLTSQGSLLAARLSPSHSPVPIQGFLLFWISPLSKTVPGSVPLVLAHISFLLRIPATGSLPISPGGVERSSLWTVSLW